MKKTFLKGTAVLLLAAAFVLVGCQHIKTPGVGATLLKALVNKGGENPMAPVVTVSDAQYSQYFRQDSAEAGVKAVIAAGEFYINGFAIPATEAEFTAKYPNGYTVNQANWLFKSEAGWMGGNGGGREPLGSYDAAAFATATGLPAGLEVRLYDTDADGYTDLIETQYLEGLVVNKITDNGNGTYSVYRGDLDLSITYSSNDGRLFDGAHFTVTSGEVIKKANLDAAIKEGDGVLFWFGPDGWVLDKAIEINGIFVEGIDHEYYQMDNVKYQDAMRFSRDNLFISNRNGEFANAHKYFGLNDNKEGLKVSLWLVPTTDYPSVTGAPVGLTSNENAGAFLAKAIAVAKAKLGSVVVSAGGADAIGKTWTTQAAYDELSAAIARAEASLTSNKNSVLLDYQIYLLYLTLHGSNDDIGAQFAGYNYVGFDKQVYDNYLY
jgi:hypothetical protein